MGFQLGLFTDGDADMMYGKTENKAPRDSSACTGLGSVLVAAFIVAIVISQGTALARPAGENAGPVRGLVTSFAEAQTETSSPDRDEDRISRIERTLESIKQTGEKAEQRSYTNKVVGAELIRYVKLMVLILVLIALGFPLSLWLLSKRRLVGLSGLSDEVTATLLVVEERQAKLTHILKEIQSEVDYLHSMSVPDLKNLIQQAETYLKQSEEDLDKTGIKRPGAGQVS